jgi:hypothetical protein
MKMAKAGWLNLLIITGCILSGLLAGGNVDRYVVQVPAWRQVNILNWAAYSRHADLGNGIFLYPFEAIGSFLTLFISSIIVLVNKPVFKYVALPLYLATILSAVGLFFTFFAAPVMLSIGTMDNNIFQLQRAFDKFHFWGLLRAIAQSLSFFASIFALREVIKCSYNKLSI